MSEQRWGFHFFLNIRIFPFFFLWGGSKWVLGVERLIQRWMWASSQTILCFHSPTQAWEECWSSEAKYLFFQCMYEASQQIVTFFRSHSGMTQAWPGRENNEAVAVVHQLLFNWHIIPLCSRSSKCLIRTATLIDDVRKTAGFCFFGGTHPQWLQL